MKLTVLPLLLLVILLTVLMGVSKAQQLEVTDQRLVTYSELSESLDRFAPPGVTSFSEILFDIQKYQMIVGARDHLYRLSVRGLQELESVHWPPASKDATLCEIKGQPAADCRNYMRVLHSRGDQLLACGTNAFQPQCTWRRLESLRTVLSNQSGIAVAPYSPRFNVTSVLTMDGDIVAATPTDFSGLDPAVYRGAGSGGRGALRTGTYDTRLLRSPQFVGSFETANFVYFVFREEAEEFSSCGERVVSRIGRVCKSDPGDRRGVWTTFLKARLNCSVAGEYPFYLDHVQSIHYLNREEVLYATFSTAENSLVGSAVCAFSLSAVEAAFDGPYRRLRDQQGSPQQRTTGELQHFQCGGDEVAAAEARRRLAFSAPDHALASQAVQPSKPDTLLLLDGVSLSGVATDVITTKHHMAVHVIFVSDSSGTVRKLSVVPRSQRTCLVEVLQPFDKPTKVLTMKLLKEEGSLYLGTESGLVRVPVQRCGRYLSEAACLAAQDPYCGWDSHRQLCSPPPGRNPDVTSWRQKVTQCPDHSRPVDGGWSDWTVWQPCGQAESSSDSEQCQCRRRTCTQPAPANGGAPCGGLSAEVSNCTRHGGWTSWSSWSACSHPCGVAAKSRRRSCTNPAPAYGGRPCVGEESQEIMCHANPPCPSRTALPVDGGWGEWGPWGSCSAGCGGGFRKRHRVCDRPRPVNGGRHCLGCDVEYGECESSCPTVRRLTDWTPWLAANGTGGRRQQRFRFACRAAVLDPDLIRVSPVKVDERYCQPDGYCSPASSGGLGWGEWSTWSECSAPCNGGVQHRSRVCEGDGTLCRRGPHRMERECNSHSCQGEWSCWSDWSSCSVTCGVGHRRRSRVCRNKASPDDAGAICEGHDISRQACEMPSCVSNDGWLDWTVWSLCDEDDEQHRMRRCNTTEPGPNLCRGHDRETRMCVHNSEERLQLASAGGTAAGGISSGMLVTGCVISFLLGAALAIAGTYYFMARRQRRFDKASQLFVRQPPPKSAAANQYVTLPGSRRGAPSVPGVPGVQELAEMKGYRRPPGSPTKTMLPPPSMLPTATIRRSGGNRYDPVSSQDLRVDLDSDTLY